MYYFPKNTESRRLYTKRLAYLNYVGICYQVHCSGTCAIPRYLIRERLNCPTSVIVKAFYAYRDRQPSKELGERGWYFFFQKSFTSFSQLSQKSCAK